MRKPQRIEIAAVPGGVRRFNDRYLEGSPEMSQDVSGQHRLVTGAGRQRFVLAAVVGQRALFRHPVAIGEVDAT